MVAQGSGNYQLLPQFPPEALLTESKDEGSALHYLLRYGHCWAGLLEHFFEASGDVEALFSTYQPCARGGSLLHAVARRHHQGVLQLLAKHAPTAYLSSLDSRGDTPLHAALKNCTCYFYGFLALLERLDEEDMLKQNYRMQTPLHGATYTRGVQEIIHHIPYKAHLMLDDNLNLPVTSSMAHDDITIALLDVLANDEEALVEFHGKRETNVLYNIIVYAGHRVVMHLLDIVDAALLDELPFGYNVVHAVLRRIWVDTGNDQDNEELLERVVESVPPECLFAKNAMGKSPADIAERAGKHYPILIKAAKSAVG